MKPADMNDDACRLMTFCLHLGIFFFFFFFFFWYSAVHNSRSMTPITWQAAVDDEE